MSDINLSHFADPRYEQAAGGWEFNEQGAATGNRNGGIEPIAQEHLRLGTVYYTFGNSKTPVDARLDRPWWVEYDQALAILQFAAARGLHFNETVRMLLAVPPEWSRVDLVIGALLEQPLRVFTGPGRAVQAADRDWNAPGTTKQIFIPGFREIGSGRATGLAARAFPAPQTRNIGNVAAGTTSDRRGSRWQWKLPLTK